ncbi:MAG: pyruvate dehydrogenase (acetyl-transferring) E1 component subunit alpha [Candidatus Izemoplasmatales bacterium]|uniref:Pyruvate dehydrogenase E1 component subunit alpha n=1 Tax=Hujiaoplasma nucleasis TaxID=2725268 RepID=A0A7L6N6R8_9MOLU|nr:pyruvate dehydrogenase (acetyl-transferring) E1 component subunit alpha [Hujiaoplasma nucleasis]QLY40214.1 pyruvate dehydrogenase (acetyl-transferring) E1 component subunit alpha [Hujiaoplasma nucleasis]
MLFEEFDPLKGKTLQILDQDGKIVNDKLVPKIKKDTLMKMYHTMVLGRIADEKALQFQRQGRMLTYAPNHGQEAAQLGSIAAMDDDDWLVLAFREMNAMLYKGVTLEQSFLYWLGNEWGSRFNDDVKVLPINVPIGSQISHAAGLAYAAKLKGTKEVAIAYIGDGGTSHGEFHEGMSFASAYDLPMIVIIQNNQYAISTPREKTIKSKTLAQKAIAYGIPGIQVDGNDPLAMYLATETARERALKGEGPTLIEAVTYRMGPHTTSDNPKLYREDSEVEEWEKKDPLKRFKKYLIDKKYWTDKKDEDLHETSKKEVLDTFKKVENSGEVDLEDIFKYTYESLTPELEKQMKYYQEFLNEEGAK